MVKGVTTTVDTIKQVDPNTVGSLSDTTIQALIDNAQLIVLGDRFPQTVEVDGEVLPVRDMATRYMTLHLASLQSSAGQGIVSEKVDVIQTTYADSTKLQWLERSPWGQAYARLFGLYGGGARNRYDVVQH